MLKMQLKILFFLVLYFCIGFYTGKATADTKLVLPVYTKHIQYTQNNYTEGFDNSSIGIEHTIDKYNIASIYVHKNSHNRHSLYNYALRELHTGTITTSLGGFLAIGGYDTGVIAAPIIAFRYKWIQIVTTYPIARLTDIPADLLNAQLIIPLEF